MNNKRLSIVRSLLCMAVIFVMAVAFHPENAFAAKSEITLSTEELMLFVGDSYHISAYFHPLVKGTSKIRFFACDPVTKEKLANPTVISVNKKTGNLKALEKGDACVLVVGTYYTKKGKVKKLRDYCQITVVGSSNFSLNKNTVVRAVGSGGQKLKVNDADESEGVTWTSSDPGIVTVDSVGNTTPVAPGTAVVSAAIDTAADTTVYYECDYVVTNPVLSKGQVNMKPGEMTELSISGISEHSSIVWSSNNEAAVTVDEKGRLTAIAGGSSTVSVKVDGVTLSCEVTVIQTTSLEKVLIMQVGQKKKLSPSIDLAVASVQYSSEDAGIATVDQKGNITAVSQGNVAVTVKAGNVQEIFHVSVLKDSLGMTVVQNGQKIIASGAKYSMDKRMEEGYYDCSSFVFRLYAPLGITFGVSADAYAPTAANLAKWLSTNGEIINKGPVYDLDQLLPGDVIFYNYNGENGRYMDIDHVSIYAGYGKIIHASDEKSGVKESGYWADNYIVMIARPVVE